MSGPPRPRPGVRVRRHLAWFLLEVGGVALDAAGRLPVQELDWCFPPEVEDLAWSGAAPGSVAALAAARPAPRRWHLDGAVRYLVRRLLRLEGLTT